MSTTLRLRDVKIPAMMPVTAPPIEPSALPRPSFAQITLNAGNFERLRSAAREAMGRQPWPTDVTVRVGDAELYIAPGHPTYPRIDTVYREKGKLGVVCGTPAPAPVPPRAPVGSVLIARIRVAPGSLMGVTE